MKIREVKARDWPVYRDLRLRALKDSPDAYSRTYEEVSQRSDGEWEEWVGGIASDPSSVTFVAEVDDRPVGMAGTQIEPNDPATARLFAMWVAPDARRRGVAAGLIDAVVRWVSARGVTQLLLAVTEGNDGAAAVYTSAGFVFTGEREPLREGSVLQMLTMRLDLEKPA